MEIKKGYNDKKTTIRIYGREDREAEVWIEETGVANPKETLSFASLDELLSLKEEIDQAIRKIANL